MTGLKSFSGIIIFFLLPLLINAQNLDLGKIDFPTSGSEAAQGQFLKGVLLLHSFEYEDAAEMEGRMDFMFGPPIIAKPSHELLGDMLLKTRNYDDAVNAYQTALKRNPGRTLSLKGLKTAAEKAGKEELAAEAASKLKNNLIKI